ncbi:hypothetical protein D1872_186240 [compost metagenome]
MSILFSFDIIHIHFVDYGTCPFYKLAENTRDFNREMNRLRTGEGFTLLTSPTYVIK